MRFCIVSYLVACAWSEDECPSVGKLGMKFAFQAQQNVTLGAPMIGKVARAILNHANSNITKLLRAPTGHPGFTFVFTRDYL